MKKLVVAAIATWTLFVGSLAGALYDNSHRPAACTAPGNRTVQLRPGLTCWVESKADGSLELLARDTAEDDGGWDCHTDGNGVCGSCTSTVVPGASHKYGPGGIGDRITTTCR